MCDFITIASIGLGIAQAGMGYAASSAQYDQRMQEMQQNAINASKAAENQYANLNIRAQQEDAAMVQQKTETNIEAAQAAASVEAAAAEGNVSGLSVSSVLQDMYAQKGRSDAALDTNQQMNRGFLRGEKIAAEAGGQNQINSMPLPEKPSFAPYLLNAFSSGLSAYSNSKTRG
ncbi:MULTISPECIES: hypothetical protein [unclassified Mesorhizobium]|uniref:virion core protein, T7 gp14 family n=1 Tax=unclassified Mesorhizobium TaxID=325217 RepID=UPI000FCC7024|nr:MULTISPECIES: hypothetical protein [unclassified Mesorhizobium]RUT88016.1 hypothetical protein EOD14_08260 [Mesorhizobium sp. M7A.T.Ca.US.000.02.1.1]RUT91850.1 hypothetical protein EOD15_13020 [Mesorhizobium sp. M7A.T.Ca.US.000.02.2.1]